MSDLIWFLIFFILGLPSAGALVSSDDSAFRVKHVPITILIAALPIFALFTVVCGIVISCMIAVDKFPNFSSKINKFLNKELIK